MRSDPHLHRFDPRWLIPGIETDREETSEEPDASLLPWDEESTNDPTRRIIVEALEQIASAGACVCPLCGAIVARDGSVLS